MQLHDAALFLKATVAVIAFCFIAGASYILNDIRDQSSDRAHPSKSKRAIASGQLPAGIAAVVAIIAVLVGLYLCFLIRPTLLLVGIAYLALCVLYTLVLRDYAVLDAFGIAAGFVLRVAAGAIAIGVYASPWLLLCTSLGALFLAFEKRRQELLLLGEECSKHRKSLAKYSPALLDRLENVVLSSLLTAYCFYSFQSEHGPWMLLTLPFVLYGAMRYQLLSTEHGLTQSPEEVLLKDRAIQITILLWLVTASLVVYDVPAKVVSWLNAVDYLSAR